MPRVDPPIQLRQYLSVAKRQGFDFEVAWRWASERLTMPHDTDSRRAYRHALEATRWAWELAYADQDVPGGPALLRLAESLTPDHGADWQPVGGRAPASYFDLYHKPGGRRRAAA